MVKLEHRLHVILLAGIGFARIRTVGGRSASCQSIDCPFKLAVQVPFGSNCKDVCLRYFKLFQADISSNLRSSNDYCLAKNKKCFGKEDERPVVTADSEESLAQAGFAGLLQPQPAHAFRPPLLTDMFCGCEVVLHLYQVRKPLPDSPETASCTPSEVCDRLEQGPSFLVIAATAVSAKWQRTGEADVTNPSVPCRENPQKENNHDTSVKWCTKCNLLCLSVNSLYHKRPFVECQTVTPVSSAIQQSIAPVNKARPRHASEGKQQAETRQMAKKQKTSVSNIGSQRDFGETSRAQGDTHGISLSQTPPFIFPFPQAFVSSSDYSTVPYSYAYGGALQYFEQTRQYQGLDRASTSHPSDNRARPSTSQGPYLARGSELAHQPQQLQELQLLDRFIIESTAEDGNGISTGGVEPVNDVELSLTLATVAPAAQNEQEQALSISELTPASAEEESLNEQCQKELLEKQQFDDFL